MFRVPATRTTPRSEIRTIGRSLDDIPPKVGSGKPRNIVVPIVWSVVALLLAMAFVGWLLVGGSPS